MNETFSRSKVKADFEAAFKANAEFRPMPEDKQLRILKEEHPGLMRSEFRIIRREVLEKLNRLDLLKQGPHKADA